MMKSFVLAFDFGGTKMAVATATPEGKILEREKISTIECGDGRTALRKAIDVGQELVQLTRRSYGGELTGAGVSTMGITREDGVEMAPNVPGWGDLKIPSSMKLAFPSVPIRIDNDVKAAALAEVRRGALRGKDYGMYVNLGTGICIAFTLGDRVLQGHNGASGEIAYCLRTKDESLGYRDGITPLEDFCGGRGISERASQHFGEPMSTKELFARASSDESAKHFLEETFEEMSFHLTNLIISWDPEIVVFGGGIAQRSDRFLPFIQRKLQQFVPFPPTLALAHFESDAALYGAIELAL